MKLEKSNLISGKTLEIGGSKSISNRLLVLQKLFRNIEIKNLSDAQDTKLLKNALNSESRTVDIHHAGTAMRFLASYFAIQEGKTTILTGSERMKQRPIKHLVDALRDLGVGVEYLENEGFPPLKITGTKIIKSSVKIPANISSQFITSLLLIAAKLEKGLEIELTGEITSRPYLEMTLKILSEIGIETSFEGNIIRVENREPGTGSPPRPLIVESDWSSASYWYSFSAIGRGNIGLKSFKEDSLQGDSVLAKIYAEFFGIKTVFKENAETELIPIENFAFPKQITLNMNDCPDIAQTLCVTAAALKIPFEIHGLATLKVKETDRLLALKNELVKIGCETAITENSIKSNSFFQPEGIISIKTYNDHRMAMSFAPFCLIQSLNIENEDVVEKSYPAFWTDVKKILE